MFLGSVGGWTSSVLRLGPASTKKWFTDHQTDHLYDLYDVDVSGQMGPWSVLQSSCCPVRALRAAWCGNMLPGLGGSVLYRSCTVSYNGRVGYTIRCMDRGLSLDMVDSLHSSSLFRRNSQADGGVEVRWGLFVLSLGHVGHVLDAISEKLVFLVLLLFSENCSKIFQVYMLGQ